MLAARMRSAWLCLVLAGMSSACVGAPPPPPGGEATGSSTTDATVSTGGGEAESLTASADAAGAGGTTTNDTTTTDTTTTDTTTTGATETTMGASAEGSSGEPPPPECTSDDECGSNELCDGAGQCVEACGGSWGAGTYGACVNEYGAPDLAGLCGGDHLCIVDNSPATSSTCSRQGCATACDCPAPPASGNAVVTCADITGGGSPTDCYLDCGDGQTCPDGMACFAGYVCMTAAPAQVPTYGNCHDGATPCAAPGFCLNGPGDASVCQQSCNDAAECPPAPPTGTAPIACGYVNAAAPGQECYLDCSGGQTCPVGMSCSSGLCLFA